MATHPANDKRRAAGGRKPTKSGPTRRYTERREAFITAATPILNRLGVGGMTLNDVAASLDLTPTSVFYYFKTKEELAAACMSRSIERLIALTKEAMKAPSGRDRPARFAELYIALLQDIENGTQLPLARFSDFSALGEAFKPEIKQYLDMFRQIRSLFSADDYSALDRRALNIRAFLLLTILAWAPAWIRRYDPLDYGRVAKRLLDIFHHGLVVSPPKGWRPPDLQDLLKNLSPGDDADPFLVAATEMINAHGYHGASVDKISAHLNLTKGAFYHRNDAKDDVVVQCFKRSFTRMQAAQRLALAKGQSGSAELARAATLLVCSHYTSHGPLLRTTALSALPPQIMEAMLAESDQIANLFGDMINDGIADGSLRAVDARIAAQVMMATLNGTVEVPQWAPGIGQDEMLQQYLGSVLTGLLKPASSS